MLISPSGKNISDPYPLFSRIIQSQGDDGIIALALNNGVFIKVAMPTLTRWNIARYVCYDWCISFSTANQSCQHC